MEFKVVIDWKFCVAVGAMVICHDLVKRMPADAVGAAFSHLVDAAKELAIAENSDC